jgi:hypothetical protein
VDDWVAAQLPERRPCLAAYILEHQPNGKIGVLFQNNDFGKDYLKGLKDGLGGLSRLCLSVLRIAAGDLLSTDKIAIRVIAAKRFDSGDAILGAAIREQVGSTVKRLHRNGAVENIGAGRASKWKLAEV